MSNAPLDRTAIAAPRDAARGHAWADGAPAVGLWLILALLVGTFFLLSPPKGETYPGAIPWSPTSILRPLVDVLALGGAVETARGVEIKSLVFQVAIVLGLLLAAALAIVSATRSADDVPGRLVRAAQGLLCAWVGLALASSLWAQDPALARGQALLYGLGVAWAAAVARFFDRRKLPELLWGVAVIGALAAGLCIWYFVERNRLHRPGFPLGNPALVGAGMLPGILAAAAIVGRSAAKRELPAILAATLLALVQLGCLWLTGGRGALLALLAGFMVLAVLSVGPRIRWWLGAGSATALVIGGLALYIVSYEDVAMARGAATRFRLYAWQAAAQLWQLRPMAGNGAAVYPRVAGELTTDARILDPAAFMSELVEHAHNELFEIFAEIGLVGGVTIVAGLLATAAAAMRRGTTGADRDPWLVRGVAAILAALIADALVGVNPRLPGGAALLYTFLGVVWAVSSERETQPASRPDGRSLLTGLACVAAALAAGGITLRDWAGVRAEFAAGQAIRSRQWDAGRELAADAEARLLDPVRVIAARKTALEARALQADEVFAQIAPTTQPAPPDAKRDAAIALAESTYIQSQQLRSDVPSLERCDAIAARAAERVAALLWPTDPNAARDWRTRAEIAWRQQRERTPFDVETNMALLRYRASLATQLGLLRDALRFGEVDAAWVQAFAALTPAPDFESQLGDLVVAASAVSPESDLDTIMASAAPEAFRVGAAYNAMKGQFETAVGGVARAERLYRAVRSRLPLNVSLALMEQSDYLMQSPLENAARAADVLQQALKALPRIQAQKHEDIARPIRLRLVRALLVAGREDAAREVQAAALDDPARIGEALATAYVDLAVAFVRRPLDQRPPLRPWLDAAQRLAPTSVLAWSWQAWLDAESGDASAVLARLAAAEKAGIPSEGIALIRRSLCREFPPLCTALGEAP